MCLNFNGCLVSLHRQYQHEQMLDDMDTQSGHSIGIVENPLYAEDEGGLQYSSTPAKDKEAEVCA